MLLGRFNRDLGLKISFIIKRRVTRLNPNQRKALE